MSDKNCETHRPRRSSRPSLLKLVRLSELSAEFGIPLSSDSESDQEFTPPTGNESSGLKQLYGFMYIYSLP